MSGPVPNTQLFLKKEFSGSRENQDLCSVPENELQFDNELDHRDKKSEGFCSRQKIPAFQKWPDTFMLDCLMCLKPISSMAFRVFSLTRLDKEANEVSSKAPSRRLFTISKLCGHMAA